MPRQAGGTFGDFGRGNFYVSKNVVTSAGGMILGRSEEAHRAGMLALHGMSHGMSKDAWHSFGDQRYKHDQVLECGFKYNTMDLQAAIGTHQWARAESSWLCRRAFWCRYGEVLTGLPLELPAPAELGTRHGHHLYAVMGEEEVDRVISVVHRIVART